MNNCVSRRRGQGSYVRMEKFVCLWEIHRQNRQKGGKYWECVIREEGHKKEGCVAFMDPGTDVNSPFQMSLSFSVPKPPN